MTEIFIKELYLLSFGKFEDKKIIFDRDFNLIYGKNESGKSTITAFIEGILYGFDEGKNRKSFSKKKEIYKPKLSYKYAGYGIFSKDGRDIKVTRNFEDGSYTMIDLSTNKEIQGKKSNINFPGEYLLGINYSLYKSYLSNFQSQKDDPKARENLLERLVNEDIDYNFSANKALEILDDRENKIGSDRAYTKVFYKTRLEIEELENKLYEIGGLKKTYRFDFEKLNKNKDELTNCKLRYDKLKKACDAYKNNRASENYRDYSKWTQHLYDINTKISDYQDVYGLDEKYLENLENEAKQAKNKSYFTNKWEFFSLIMICLGLGFFVNKYFYILAMALALTYFILLSKDKSVNNGEDLYDKYNKTRARYLRYKSLREEKDKVEEVIKILEKQDIKDSSLTNFDLDLDDFDIVKSEEDLDRMLEEISSLNKEIASQEKDLLRIEDKIKDELDLVERLNFLKKKFSDLEKTKKAILLSKNIIRQIVKENPSDFRRLNNRISSIIKEISKNAYESIVFDEKLRAKIRTSEGYYMALDQLSTGFFDQLNFALKLSLNEEVFADIFMIYDDAFINYDRQRLRNALFFLLDSSSKRQVIYFSCHEREKEIFDAEEIKINYIDVEDVWYMQ